MNEDEAGSAAVGTGGPGSLVVVGEVLDHDLGGIEELQLFSTGVERGSIGKDSDNLIGRNARIGCLEGGGVAHDQSTCSRCEKIAGAELEEDAKRKLNIREIDRLGADIHYFD